MKYIRYKIQNYLKVLTAKKGDYDDPVDTDIELEKNVAKKKESSTSDSVARQLKKIHMKKLIHKKKWILMT